MPVNHYECLIMFDPTKISGNFDGAKSTIHATLEKHGVEVLAARKWGDEKKLVYPVKGHKKSTFYLTYFKADSLKIDSIQVDLRLNESVLRFMTQLIPTKWEEEMLAVAQDENRLAFQSMSEEMSGDRMGEEGFDMPMETRSRRPRRSMNDDSGKD